MSKVPLIETGLLTLKFPAAVTSAFRSINVTFIMESLLKVPFLFSHFLHSDNNKYGS